MALELVCLELALVDPSIREDQVPRSLALASAVLPNISGLCRAVQILIAYLA
jgi:hypothetical protein